MSGDYADFEAEKNERYIRITNEIIEKDLLDLFRHMVNNSPNLVRALRILLKYRELFYSYCDATQYSLVINKNKFIKSIVNLKDMERIISLEILGSAYIEIDEPDEPIYKNAINKNKMKTWGYDFLIREITIEIIMVFNRNLKLKIKEN